MGTVRTIVAGIVVATILLPWARPVSAATPVAAFLHARHLLASPAESEELLMAAQQNPTAFLGHVFEITATVSGLMTADGQETAILTAGPQLTVPTHVPPSLAGAAWLKDTGGQLRALVRVDRTGNSQSLSNLSLVAAAPEGDVAAAEQAAISRAQAVRAREEALQSRRVALLASRSLAYRRDETPETWSPTDETPSTAFLTPAALRVRPAYQDAIHRLNTRLSDNEVNTITDNLLHFSNVYGVDPRLVMAMMIAESGFDINSTSRTGAMGLGQLMPETARGLGVTNAYDPAQNIEASVRLLRSHLDQYGGRLSLTMAAYNAGPGAVSKYHGVPPYRETQHYVAKVASLYRQLCGG